MKSRIVLSATFIIVMAMAGLCSADELQDSLDSAKKQGKLVMLEIGSCGCIPCDKMKGVMDQLRSDYKDKLEVIFIDVRYDKKNMRRFGVTMIPTQVFLDKTGKEFNRHIGYYAYEEIVPMLQKTGL